MVEQLVDQLAVCPEVTKIILIQNIPETAIATTSRNVTLIENAHPKGFGANHNAAFAHCDEPYFCVLNPDIKLIDNPFPHLLRCLDDCAAAVAAPLIISPQGRVEDGVRRFPTIFSLLRKAIRGDDGGYPLVNGGTPVFPDWVAGMFMLFRSNHYETLGGFDEDYFLYYEDVDICRRAWHAGMRVVACPSVQAIHDARRASHRDLRHLRWHLTSMARFLWRSR